MTFLRKSILRIFRIVLVARADQPKIAVATLVALLTSFPAKTCDWNTTFYTIKSRPSSTDQDCIQEPCSQPSNLTVWKGLAVLVLRIFYARTPTFWDHRLPSHTHTQILSQFLPATAEETNLFLRQQLGTRLFCPSSTNFSHLLPTT